MNRSWPLLALLLCLTLPLTAFAADNQIQFESRAEIEVRQALPDGSTITLRQPAALVVPGTLVIYSNVMTNVGTEPAENLVVSNPIPLQMIYVAGSALPESAAITFSVDGGKTFAAPETLTVTGGDGKERPAVAEDYTHIRWLITEALAPGATTAVEFRAKLQ